MPTFKLYNNSIFWGHQIKIAWIAWLSHDAVVVEQQRKREKRKAAEGLQLFRTDKDDRTLLQLLRAPLTHIHTHTQVSTLNQIKSLSWRHLRMALTGEEYIYIYIYSRVYYIIPVFLGTHLLLVLFFFISQKMKDFQQESEINLQACFDTYRVPKEPTASGTPYS